MASALGGVYHRKSVISPWTNLFHIDVRTNVLSMVKSCTSSAAEGSGLVIETRGRGAGGDLPLGACTRVMVVVVCVCVRLSVCYHTSCCMHIPHLYIEHKVL